MFNTYIYRILNLLHSTDAQTTVKVLIFLCVKTEVVFGFI